LRLLKGLLIPQEHVGMNLVESLRVALSSLAANKMRSALTMLGVLIGVGAVICMIAIGQGAKLEALRRIEQFGSNVIFVFSARSRRGVVVGGFGSAQSLTVEDSQAILKQCRLIKAVAPEVRQAAQVKYRNFNATTSIVGTTPEYLSVRNFRVERGRMFTHREVESMARVCVVGHALQEDLFRGANPVGKVIRIAGVPFKVIGLMAEKGSLGFTNPDDQITVPLTTAMNRLFGLRYLSGIAAQALGTEVMNEAQKEVEELLRKRHRLGANEELDFTIRNQAERIEEAEQTSRMFMLLLAGIASISLLVGGIGIMNIMLVSVTERTREIGIRKAVGARRSDILLQFLIESVVLSMVGGCVGIGLGFIGSRLFAHFFGWTVVISPATVFIAFGFAFFVGVFFGMYPAYRASALEPVEALRYE